MEHLSQVTVEPLNESKFLIPKRVHYKQNGKGKQWDCIVEHSDVYILVFNTSRNVLVFVKQFRPAVYFSSSKTEQNDDKVVIDTNTWPASLGVTIELCAGIVDKEGSLEEIAREEILEECGYDTPVTALRKITSFRSGVDLSGAKVTMFYAEVTDGQKVGPGGGLATEGELIDVIELSISESHQLMFDESVNKDPTLILALQWFFHNMWTDKVS